jgi:hypothetical protein
MESAQNVLKIKNEIAHCSNIGVTSRQHAFPELMSFLSPRKRIFVSAVQSQV